MKDLYEMATKGKSEDLWNAYAREYNKNNVTNNTNNKMTIYVPPAPEQSGPVPTGHH